MTLTRAIALLVLLDALMAVLVVDLTCLLDTENIVCFGDCDKLLVCGIIPTEFVSMARKCVENRYSPSRTGSYLGETSCSVCGRLS